MRYRIIVVYARGVGKIAKKMEMNIGSKLIFVCSQLIHDKLYGKYLDESLYSDECNGAPAVGLIMQYFKFGMMTMIEDVSACDVEAFRTKIYNNLPMGSDMLSREQIISLGTASTLSDKCRAIIKSFCDVVLNPANAAIVDSLELRDLYHVIWISRAFMKWRLYPQEYIGEIVAFNSLSDVKYTADGKIIRAINDAKFAMEKLSPFQYHHVISYLHSIEPLRNIIPPGESPPPVPPKPATWHEAPPAVKPVEEQVKSEEAPQSVPVVLVQPTPPPSPKKSEADYQKMTVPVLKQLCASRGIGIKTCKKKSDYISLLILNSAN